LAELSTWFFPLLIAVFGMGIVITLTLRARGGEPAASARRASVPEQSDTGRVPGTKIVQIACTICHKQLVINPVELRPLTPVELALSVRSVPDLAGRKLAEYVCPYCESAHCFNVDRRVPLWVGVNLYSPQTKTARCQECGKRLLPPPWPPGAYDGRLREAPDLHQDYGLVCSRCDAVVCVSCTLNATRNRTKDGSFVCPRCMRTPVNKMYHPA
jgi:hypothetical protein